jgi:hypothetical protein
MKQLDSHSAPSSKLIHKAPSPMPSASGWNIDKHSALPNQLTSNSAPSNQLPFTLLHQSVSSYSLPQPLQPEQISILCTFLTALYPALFHLLYSYCILPMCASRLDKKYLVHLAAAASHKITKVSYTFDEIVQRCRDYGGRSATVPREYKECSQNVQRVH